MLQIERRYISDNYGQIQLTDMSCCWYALLSRKKAPDPQDEYGENFGLHIFLFPYLFSELCS